VEISPKLPDVSLETRLDIKVARNTLPDTIVTKVDESVEIRPKSPNVNLEIGVDGSVVGNK
jgi:hypothetical protein